MDQHHPFKNLKISDRKVLDVLLQSTFAVSKYKLCSSQHKINYGKIPLPANETFLHRT